MLYGDDPVKFGGVYVPAIAAMLQSGNLYVYCMNNPLLYFDSDGAFALSNKAKVIIGAVALTAAVALTVATGGGAAVVAAGVAKVVGSVALSTAVSAGLGYLENGKQGAIDGAANGFMFASLSVAGGAAVKYAKAAKAERLAFSEWLNKGNADNTVYHGIINGEAKYTGITKQSLSARLSQHNRIGSKLYKGFDYLQGVHDNLTRNQARAIEQYYIEHGPNAMNRINSIAKNSKYFKCAMKWAKRYLGK